MRRFLYVLITLLLITAAITVSVFLRERGSPEEESSASATDGVASVVIYPDEDNRRIELFDHFGVNMGGDMKIFLPENADLYASILEKYREAGFNDFRFPNGCYVGSYDWSQNQFPGMGSVRKFAEDSNSQITFEMSAVNFLPAPNDPSHAYKDPCGWDVTVRFSQQQIEQFVIDNTINPILNGKQNYVKTYELGNEEWGYHNNTLGRFITPGEYITAASRVSGFIRAKLEGNRSQLAARGVQPEDIKILGTSDFRSLQGYTGEPASPPSPEEESIVWGVAEYRRNQNFFDRITSHGYWHDYWLGENYYIGDSMFAGVHGFETKLKGFVNYFPEIPKFQAPAFTEWNLYCWTHPEAGRRHINNGKFENGLFALAMLTKFIEYKVPYTHLHMFSDSQTPLACTTLFRNSGSRGPYNFTTAGAAHKYLRQNSGDTFVKTEVTSDTFSADNRSYPLLLTSSSKKENTIYSILINRSPDENLETNLKVTGRNSGFHYSIDQWTAPNYGSAIEDVTYSKVTEGDTSNDSVIFHIPAHTAFFVKITPKSVQDITPTPTPTPTLTITPTPTPRPGGGSNNPPQTLLSYDLNRNDAIDIGDFISFKEYYIAGDSRIDYNRDGRAQKDIGDFIIFAEAYRNAF